MKKFFIALIGGTVLLVGVALLVLPGPGLPIIAASVSGIPSALLALPGGRAALLAFEQGPAKGPVSVVVEALAP